MNVHFKPVLQALSEEGIQLRNDAPGDHKVVCPRCSHTRRKKTDPCLSVTIQPDNRAVWKCHHCEFQGGTGGQRNKEWRPVQKNYRKPEKPKETPRPDKMLQWFDARAISAATVERFGVYRKTHWFPQTRSELTAIAFPYVWDGELRNTKYRSAEKHFAQEKNAMPTLFNADSIKPGEDLIWVEGECDVMAFAEAGYDRIVSLPNGAPTENDEGEKRYEPLNTHAEALEAVSEIYIATDTDAAGQRLADELARRLGRERCSRVSFPDSESNPAKDANECLQHHGKEVLIECLNNAEPWPIDGLFRVDAFASEVMDLYHGRGPQPLSTGFPDMDQAFKVIPGQFVIVTGIPNHGKSRWLDQVAIQMSQREEIRWGVFSPETGNAQHISDLIEIRAGQPFSNGPTPRMDEDTLERECEWVSSKFFFIDAEDHTPTIDWVLQRAKAAVLRHGITGLIVDPYNEIEASRPPNQTETEFVSQLISKCKRFAQAHDVMFFMVAHPKMPRNRSAGEPDPVPSLYDISGSAHWRNKSDAGLVVYRDYDRGVTRVIAQKIRRQPICGHLGSSDFSFIGTTRRFEEQTGSYKPLSNQV
jgi:twinkle protein